MYLACDSELLLLWIITLNYFDQKTYILENKQFFASMCVFVWKSVNNQMIETKNALADDSETKIHQKEEQIKNLRLDLSR